MQEKSNRCRGCRAVLDTGSGGFQLEVVFKQNLPSALRAQDVSR